METAKMNLCKVPHLHVRVGANIKKKNVNFSKWIRNYSLTYHPIQ
jgi:hypothetical protein